MLDSTLKCMLMFILILEIKINLLYALFLCLFIVRNDNILLNNTDNIWDAGKVYVDGKVISKAGTPIPEKAVVEIIADVPKYVCR